MINGEKIGVGIITCDREEFFRKCINFDYSSVDMLIVVDDGINKINMDWVLENVKIPINTVFISNEINLGVAKNKNKALKEMIKFECDHLFLIEDDMQIKDPKIFEMYIMAAKKSGIQHFNYGPGSPFNRKQDIEFDMHNRHLLNQKSEILPRLTINYDEVSVDLFTHTVAMFTYYSRECIEKVGLIDENYINAWEHVDHTYSIIKAGLHPPFWYFADLHDSINYIEEQPDAIANSSIAKDNTKWMEGVMAGREIYKFKHGHYPNEPPTTTESDVFKSLKALKP